LEKRKCSKFIMKTWGVEVSSTIPEMKKIPFDAFAAKSTSHMTVRNASA
jgi:hypothetical protein